MSGVYYVVDEVDVGLWLRRKEEFRKRLMHDLDIGYLDRDILDVLQKIFDFPEYFTLSSCSGRISLVDAVMPWERDESTVIFKKHSPITVEELRHLMRQKAVRTMWLVVTGPIIHVSSRSLSDALRIIEVARKAGMKHSGIISSSKKGVVAELVSGVHVSAPLKRGADVLVADRFIPVIASIANKALLAGKDRLNRLRTVLGLKPVDYISLWSSSNQT
jgi:tRNA wybutosine-synthesizing protein 3